MEQKMTVQTTSPNEVTLTMTYDDLRFLRYSLVRLERYEVDNISDNLFYDLDSIYIEKSRQIISYIGRLLPVLNSVQNSDDSFVK